MKKIGAMILITVVSGLCGMQKNGEKLETLFPQAFKHEAYKYPGFLESLKKSDSCDMRISFMRHRILSYMQIFGCFANDAVAKIIEGAEKPDMPGKGMVPDDQAVQLLNFFSKSTMPTLENEIQNIKQMVQQLEEYKQKLEKSMSNL